VSSTSANTLDLPTALAKKSTMPFDLGKRLFPQATPWEQHRKMDAVYLVVGGCVIAVIGVALLLIMISGQGRIGGGSSHSPSPASKAAGRR
jgi:hypothetical protein